MKNTDPKTKLFMEFFSKEMGVKFVDADTGEEIKVEEEHETMVNTQILTRCDSCNCITYTMMDDDGNRYCGKCGGKKWH